MAATRRKEDVSIQLRYAGKDVEDGSMSIEDIIPALQGFSSAYGKIAAEKGQDVQHNIRVTGVSKGSFDILLEVWSNLGQYTDQYQAIGALATAASFVSVPIIKSIVEVISLTKHVKGKPYSETINGVGGSVVIKNSENVNLEVNLNVYQLFKEKTLAQDLYKITKPLELNKIDSTEILAESGSTNLKEVISIDEKPYFDVEEVIVAKTAEMWLTGILNSLTKTTNRGFFILNDGTRIGYRLAAERPEHLYKYFLYKGPVRVKCIAHLDENLKPAHIDIIEIQPIQNIMFAEAES